MFLDLTKTHVNYQYHIIGKIRNKIVPILIDTGAAYSHISRDFATTIETSDSIKIITDNNSNNRILSQCTTIKIKISEQTYKLKILIDETPHKVLLGIDFLENFNYEIHDSYIELNGTKCYRIKMHEEQIKKILEKLD